MKLRVLAKELWGVGVWEAGVVVLDRCAEGVGFLKNLVGLLVICPDKAPKNEDDVFACLGCNRQENV